MAFTVDSRCFADLPSSYYNKRSIHSVIDVKKNWPVDIKVTRTPGKWGRNRKSKKVKKSLMVNSYTRILPLVGHGKLILPRLLIDTSHDPPPPIISRTIFQLFPQPQYLYLIIVHQCKNPSDIPMSVCLDDGPFSFLWVVIVFKR